jgi:ferredoxin
MRIVTHPERCISSGACVLAAPHLFGQDEDGLVVALVAKPSPAEQDDARRAAIACPVAVIELEDDREEA